MKKKWFVYILETKRGLLYTGISTDPKRRFEEHLSGKKGAKFTKANKPREIVYLETCRNRSLASKREAQIKKLTRAKKIELIQSCSISFK